MSVFDPEILASLKEVGQDDPTFFPELIRLYLDQHHRRSAELEGHWQNGRLPEIASIVHMIKSSSGNLGANHLMKICEELEQAAATGNRSEVDRLFPLFRENYLTAAHELRAMQTAG